MEKRLIQSAIVEKKNKKQGRDNCNEISVHG